jgi:NAD(P)-dependent dehydrogenase (short-subunit alcohol dehydrogenase family)
MALAEAGARVVIASRTPEEIERVAAEIQERHGPALAIECDVSDEASVHRLAEAANLKSGTIDILVNNAGAGASAPLAEITIAEWNRLLATNATGTFLCTRQFLPGMLERHFGRVINIASLAGLEGGKYIAHYAAAKHAVVGLTRAVAAEVDGTGVTINALCPGYVDTPMTERTLANVQERTGLTRPKAMEAVLRTTGQKRLVKPEEVAAQVLELCEESAGEVNGQAIALGAGAAAL